MAARAHRGSYGWRPLAGPDLLERLRNTGRPRPLADPELSGRLRLILDQGLPPGPDGTGTGPRVRAGRAGPGGHGPRPGSRLVVTKDRLTRVLACEAHQVVVEFGERPPTIAMACGAIVDALFRQLVTVGSIGEPMVDGLAALSVDDHQRALVSWIERLPGPERDQLHAEVDRQAGGLCRRWPSLDPSWLPRTQEVLRVPVAGGTVELSARVDLAIGAPATDEASVAIVEIKSGLRRAEHRSDLHFYALLESLRSPAPPFVVATYYTRTGEFDVDPVSEELLVGAARRTLAGTGRLWRLSQGSDRLRSATSLCGACAARPEYSVGRWPGHGQAGGGLPGEATP
jgi:hypothetical protein